MREFSAKPFEEGEHVLVDGEEYIAKKGYTLCSECTFKSEQCTLIPCQYYLFEKVEKPKPIQLMTFLQLAEWLAKGNGQAKLPNKEYFYSRVDYDVICEESSSNALIRPWGSTEWITPTLDIYERDCK